MKSVLVRVGLSATLLLLTANTSVAAPILLGAIGFGSPTNKGRVTQVDQVSGSGTLLPGAGAGPNAGLNGLTFDMNGALFGSAIGNTIFADPTVDDPTLMQFDPVTGTAINSVPITFGGSPLEVTDLAAQPGTGLLYATSFTSTIPGSSIYTINKTDGTATLVGATGVIGVTLAFAPDGTLYMSSATFDNTGAQTGSFLHTVNPFAGTILTTVPIGQLPSGNFVHLGGLGVRPTDGAIFAAGREANVAQRGDIFALSTTGMATRLGSTGVGEVGDLAFEPVPEPTTLLLLTTGLLVIGAFARRRN